MPHTRSQGTQNLLTPIDNIQQLRSVLRNQRANIESQNTAHTAMADNTIMSDSSLDGNQQQSTVRTPASPPPRRIRQIGAGDAPTIHARRHGIRPPPIPNNNFEIKSGLITMVQNNKFHGLPAEDPLDHLDEFERICGLIRINGLSEDALKLRLFPFSLGDKAHLWEKHLPQNLITTWADCKRVFLAKFFSTSRTAKLRNSISNFVQSSTESLAEAWERYKTYQSQCPHHGFSEETILSQFYRGIQPKLRMLLDTASNGNFLSQDVDDGRELIENLALADGQYGEEFDRTERRSGASDTYSTKELKSLSEKLDKLLSVHHRQVNLVEEATNEEGEDELVEEISFLQNQGGPRQYNNFRQNNNLSYRSNNVANPEDQVYPPKPAQQRAWIPKQEYYQSFKPAPPASTPESKANSDIMAMLQQIQQTQTQQAEVFSKQFTEVHKKIDASHNDLNCKFETLNARLKYVESQQASTSVKTQGQLPGKAVQNPKEYTAQSITLRSGKELPTRAVAPTATEDSGIPEGEDEQAREKNTPQLATPTPQLAGPTRQPARRVDPEASAIPVSEPTTPKANAAKPQAPFPTRLKKDQTMKFRELFEKQMREVELKIPLLDAFALIPQYQKFLKEAVKAKVHLIEGLEVESFECQAVAEAKVVLRKLEDPGTFTLPCSLGHLNFKKGLCDLGASISLMPYTVAKRLGFNNYKHSKLSLVLADRSTRSPHGLLENLPVRIGNVEIPTDFIVINMDEEPQDPILLGRPFLASIGAVIDVKNKAIELDLGGIEKLEFNLSEDSKKPTIEGQSFTVTGLNENPEMANDEKGTLASLETPH